MPLDRRTFLESTAMAGGALGLGADRVFGLPVDLPLEACLRAGIAPVRENEVLDAWKARGGR